MTTEREISSVRSVSSAIGVVGVKVTRKGPSILLTPEHVVKAAGLIKRGKVYSLSVPLEPEGPLWPSRHKLWHTTTINHKAPGRGSSDDVITMHSHSGTHIDSLCHMWYDHQLYNGAGVDEHSATKGPPATASTMCPISSGAGCCSTSPAGKG